MRNHLGLIEMLLVLGCALAFAIWELWSLRASKRSADASPIADTPEDRNQP